MALLDKVKKKIIGPGKAKTQKKEVVSKKQTSKKKSQEAVKKKRTPKLQSSFYKIIRKPIVTEKTTELSTDGNILVARVRKESNKSEVKKICTKYFGIKAASVRIINQPSKKRRRGNKEGRKSGYKKVIVKFAKKIEL